MAFLQVHTAGKQFTQIELRKGTVLGRAFDCELHLPDREVSRHHCRVDLVDEDWVLTDLASKNGTQLNQRPVTAAILQPNQHFKVGPYDVTFTNNLPPHNPVLFSTPPAPIDATDSDQTVILPAVWDQEPYTAPDKTPASPTLQHPRPAPARLPRLSGKTTNHSPLVVFAPYDEPAPTPTSSSSAIRTQTQNILIALSLYTSMAIAAALLATT